MSKRKKEFEKLYDQAFDLAIKEIEEAARRIMRNHPRLVEYCQGMGTWMFSDADDNLYDGDDRICKPVDDIMQKWDEYLHLTGHPMRFTVDGPVITMW